MPSTSISRIFSAGVVTAGIVACTVLLLRFRERESPRPVDTHPVPVVVQPFTAGKAGSLKPALVIELTFPPRLIGEYDQLTRKFIPVGPSPGDFTPCPAPPVPMIHSFAGGTKEYDPLKRSIKLGK